MVANVLFLLALGFGGALVPIADLPAPVADRSSACSRSGRSPRRSRRRSATGEHRSLPLGILLVWAVVADVVAARTFRWD